MSAFDPKRTFRPCGLLLREITGGTHSARRKSLAMRLLRAAPVGHPPLLSVRITTKVVECTIPYFAAPQARHENLQHRQ